MPGQRVAIAADHNGVELKTCVRKWLEVRGFEVVDLGADEDSEVVDYPSMCVALALLVRSAEADWAVMVGGSGQGEVIALNKIPGIRAGVCHTVFAATISRGHNLANALVLGAKVVCWPEVEDVLQAWVATPFKGGVHQDRVDQLADLESRTWD